MVPPPPALLTTVIDVGTALFRMNKCSSMRAVLSLLPPGGELAMISTFFCGDQPCACAMPQHSRSAYSTRFCFMIPPETILSCKAYSRLTAHESRLPGHG